MFAPLLGFSTLLAEVATSAPATAAGVAADPKAEPLISDPAGVLAVLFAVLGVIFWLTQHPVVGRLFKVVPALVFCYFVPTTLTTLGVIPDSSPLYSWVKTFILPASLLLLIVALDVPGILRLGPKALIMMLAGTFGVVIGGPISLYVCQWILPADWALPDDAWRGMSALAGSWIGGGANFVAIGEAAHVSPSMLSAMVVPDVFVASIWMGILLYCAGQQRRIDRFTGANAQAIRDLEQRMTEFQARVTRIPQLPDLMVILAFAFLGCWLSYWAGGKISAAIEDRLVVDAITLTSDASAVLANTVELGNDKESAGEFVLTLTIGNAGDGEAIKESASVPTARHREASFNEYKLKLSAPEMDSFGELVSYINATVPGWRAELAPRVAPDRPCAELRHIGDSKVTSAGLTLKARDPERPGLWSFHTSMSPSTWKFILVTSLGVLLSFTAARNLEGAGASKIGAVMIYLLVACIGASADFREIGKQPAFMIMGFIWITIHIVVLLGVGWLIKAPIFFIAVGSQSNIGGAASAPVVAAAYHPALAPVGALLAVAGYVLGTYAGLVCMQLLKWVAGAQ